jgi:hypothetical protein
VFIAERLAERIAEHWPQVTVRHSALPEAVKLLSMPPPARRDGQQARAAASPPRA